MGVFHVFKIVQMVPNRAESHVILSVSSENCPVVSRKMFFKNGYNF